MTKTLKNKVVLSIVIAIASLLLFGAFLVSMQTSLSVKNQQKDTKLKLSQMEELVKAADEAAQQSTEAYDDIYIAKVKSLSYLAELKQGAVYTPELLQEINEVLEVTNLLILDKEGNQIASKEESKADLTQSRFNQLRTVFETGEASEAFEVNIDDINRRYYGAKIDDNTMAVIEQDAAELKDVLDNTSTWKSILSNVSVGLDGFAFAVSNRDYTFLYYPEEERIGQDALQAGIDAADLEKDNYVWMDVDGERLYCGVSVLEDAYIICAVTEEEIIASRNLTVALVLFIFFAVLAIVILYAVLTLKEEQINGLQGTERFAKVGGFFYNKNVGRKIGTVSMIGLVAVLVMSFYMQTLFSLSRQSMSNQQHVQEVQKVLDYGEKNVKTITEQYDNRYLNKCKIAAYLISSDEKFRSRQELETLSKILGVEFINIFDENGVKSATNAMYTKFQISDNPEDQSYEFNKILKGADFVIQEARRDDISGDYRQYIGVALRDDSGESNGFVQIAITPSKLEEALSNTQISYVLKGVKVGADGFAFAVNKKDKTFAYYPSEKLIGRKAVNYGMEKSQFRDEYNDYIKIGTKEYYGSSLETDDYYIYVVVPVSEMTDNRGEVALVSTAASFLCLLILFLILTLSRTQTVVKNQNEKKDGPMIDVVMPDGSVRKTQSAASRWSNIAIGWDDKTPEQKICGVLGGIFAVLAIAISIVVIFKEELIHSNSVLLSILDGKWERGVNIFSITSCLMIICVVSVMTMLLRKVLQVLARTFGARGETLCRLISSFVKYASVIVMLYYCLALLGVDTKTLLASAGILTLVVGLGAKTLVSDILAGLFIIFEGEFRVGDIVTIGDCRGTVAEIGIRTTKIEMGSQDVKVISNSAVSGVINMTKFHSYASSDIGIEYGESLERVENILEKELPNIKKRVPSIQEGPFYKGVVELGDSSVIIRIVAQCAETDRIQLGRDLNREMKLLFDRYDISIPFPQVVINQPSLFKEATEWEKKRADIFHQKQAELSKNIEEEDER